MVMELWAILKPGCGYLKLKLSVILPAWGWFVCLFFGGFFKGKIVCLPLISLGAFFYFVSVVIATNPRMGFFFFQYFSGSCGGISVAMQPAVKDCRQRGAVIPWPSVRLPAKNSYCFAFLS